MQRRGRYFAALIVLTLGGGRAVSAQLLVQNVQQFSVNAVAVNGQSRLALGSLGSPGVQVLLRSEARRVEVVQESPTSGIVIAVAASGAGGQTVDVIDFNLGDKITSFPAFAASVSPDGSFVAFEAFRRGNDDAVRYCVIPATSGKIASNHFSDYCTFPGDDLKHTRMSNLQWLDSNTVAFIDYSNKKSHLVVIQLDQKGTVTRSATKALPPDDIVNGASNPTAPLAKGILNPEITKLDGEGLQVRLRFPLSGFLRVRRIDITVW